MSDILSKFYKTFYNRKNAIKMKENNFTPNKNQKKDITAQNLSNFGIYLSKNNILLISRKTKSPLSLPLNKNINSNNIILSENNKKKDIENKKGIEENQLSLTSKNNKNAFNTIHPELKKCFSYKRKNKILLYNIHNLKKDHKIKTSIIKQNINPININNKKKSRNIFSDFSTTKRNFYNNNYSNNTNNNFRTTTSDFSSSKPENRTYYKTITKERKSQNLFYKETEKDKINNKIEADKIINELLSLKTKKEIKSYYLKKDYAKAISEAENKEGNKGFNINNTISPMTYIKFNLKNEPKNNSLFKSYDTQILIMGNKKYRNELLDGINIYKDNCLKYQDLRGPIGFDKNNINEKRRSQNIKKMKMNFIGERGLLFSNRLYKKKLNKLKDYDFDDNYKNMKVLLFKNLDKYEKQIKIVNGKKETVNIDPNDINILKKFDDYAEYIIQDKDEMIKFSHKFLSFDEKSDKILSKIRNTSNYLSKRAQENHKIKQKIDKLYINI